MFQWFFTQTTNSWDEVVYVPTTAGYVLLVVLLAAVIALFAAFLKREQKKLTAKQLTFCGMAVAIAMVLSFIKAFEMPFGGSITMFSMFFICIIGYWYGARVGIMAGVAYGMLQFITDPVFYSIPQMLVDYPLAFGALGLSGLLRSVKGKGILNGLTLGYVLGVFGRYCFAVLSGVIFFASYAGDQNPILYSLSYNLTYILPEAVITLIVLMIPQVQKALIRIRTEALS